MLVFTDNSVRALIDLLRGYQGERPSTPGRLTDDLALVHLHGHEWYVHRRDATDLPLTLISADAIAEVAQTSTVLERLLERCERVSRGFRSPPVSLPPTWHKFQTNNLIAFFALPRPMNAGSFRWIAEHLGNGDVAFWQLTSKDNERRLAAFSQDPAAAEALRANWPEALAAGQALLPPINEGARALQPAVDLDVVGASAVSRERPYTSWRESGDLTKEQLEIIGFRGPGALKVRGPAGTGKTLVLQLKALHDLYAAADQEEESLPRILYLTHSWALAELVDRSFSIIDDRGLADSSITVMPLAWVREQFYGDLPEGVEILGEDSIDGKREQIRLLSEAIDEILISDWSTYRSKVGEETRKGVESSRDDAARVVLCWKMMREIAEVIDANQLKPGLNTLRRYIDLPRAPWMVDFSTQGDRQLVYAVYRRFLDRLREEGQLTSDQALDDFRKYLESYAWNLRRTTEGFDIILVDEFHLFSDTERYLVHLLTRDPELPPYLVLALDPHQSMFALLTGLPDGDISRRASENAQSAGDVSQVDLDTVHRFSGEVLEFVRLIHTSYPNLVDIGADWRFDLSETTASRQSGDRPKVHVAQTRTDAANLALNLANRLNEQSPTKERTALIAAGSGEFEALQEVLQPGGDGPGLTVIQSREDIARLGYARRSMVVTTAEFSAGLQFTHVIVLAFADRTASHGEGTSAARASLSELYLAVTRAEATVDVVTSGEDGQVGELLKRAVEQGVAVSV